MQVNIKLPQEVINKLTNALSFIIYKGTKRNVQKHNNYKSLRIKSIDGYYNDSGLSSDYLFTIEMTNKDKIESKYSRKSENGNLIENSIYVEINGKQMYHLDNNDYEINSFINMIGTQYKKYIETKWKIK